MLGHAPGKVWEGLRAFPQLNLQAYEELSRRHFNPFTTTFQKSAFLQTLPEGITHITSMMPLLNMWLISSYRQEKKCPRGSQMRSWATSSSVCQLLFEQIQFLTFQQWCEGFQPPCWRRRARVSCRRWAAPRRHPPCEHTQNIHSSDSKSFMLSLITFQGSLTLSQWC